MRYVQRDGQAKIIADFANAQPGYAEEQIDEAAAEFIAYRNPPADPRLVTDEAERLACKVDVQVLPLVNQTKAEWITWAGANFPSLTAAERTRLGILFWVVSVGVRKFIRNGG